MFSYTDLANWTGIIGCVLLILGIATAGYASSRKCRRINKTRCYGIALILGALGATCLAQTLGYIDIPSWPLPVDKL